MEEAQRRSEQISGISNVAYDLMAVLYNKLEAVAALEEYIADAEDDGDDEARSVFEEIQQEETGQVERLRRLLVQRLG